MWFKASNPSDPRFFGGRTASSTSKNTNAIAGNQLHPNFGVLLVALMAMATLQMFRLGHARWLLVLGAEALLFLALPWVIFVVVRYQAGGHFHQPSAKTRLFGFQSGAIATGLLVLLWQGAIRVLGFGDANEIVALLVLQSVGWYLSVFSRVPGFEKASLMLNGALVFFVCCIAEDKSVFVMAGLCAVVGLWWLLGQYWNRLESKAIDGDAKSLKLQGSVISLTTLIVLLVVCTAAAIPFSRHGVHMAGFMPFSGGERGSQDEFAISGIGDGKMLTAGDNAVSAGAVESDQFIEDGKPSLYDITSERYEGPIVKVRRNKTVALSAIAKHLHEAKKSEQSGRTFRTMRNTTEIADIDLADRETKALFFVEGSVPARFSINNFYKFDGWDWSSEPRDSISSKPPRITQHQQNGAPVFRIARNIASYLTGRRTHRIKIMRLDSCTIPAPALLHQWHIPLVDKLDMFCWGETGLVEMDVDSIASHTIIDLQSLVPNYHALRRNRNHLPLSTLDRSKKGFDSDVESDSGDFLQVPETASRSEIERLASQYTVGKNSGWTQVESIVNHFRRAFTLNPSWNVNAESADSVHLFLGQGGGPSYMFATSCAMVLRSAGFKTRLASGFVVQKKDYDSSARQSIVSSGNFHFWPEVCLDGKFWIPVEPTPGYPIPYSTQTVWQWMNAKAVMVWLWLCANPILVTTLIVFFGLLMRYRAECITAAALGWWMVVRVFWPQRLLKATRQLIDLRFWCAGDQRPASQTISTWYTRVEANALTAFINLWNVKNYSGATPSVSRQDVAQTCRSAINTLSLKRIKASHTANSTNPQ